MTTFLVEGRRLVNRRHAITFAQHEAKRLGRDVEVRAEVEEATPVRMVRKWIATMHPPGTKMTTAIKQPLKRVARAGGE